PDHVVVRGGRRLPPPPYDVTIAGHSVVVAFRGLGDHSPYTIELTDGGGTPLHPFFASAEFRFTIDCETGDCRPSPAQARRPPVQPPAVDLLTKDFNGFVMLLADWVKVRNPHIADLSGASFERLLIDLLAWAGDTQSYYQDRVANEAFVETAGQRFSLRQHAVLLGTRLDDGHAPTTLLTFDVGATGFVPAGLQVRMRTSQDEVPVSFTVASRTRVRVENDSAALRVAAFPGAFDAEVPAGATELLLWGHGFQLQAGDRLAFVQGSFAQVVTLATAPLRLEEPGWVEDPSQPFDPLADPPAEVTRVRWIEPLARAVQPWGTQPLVLHANLVGALYGTPRRAVVDAYAAPRRDEIAIRLTRRTSIVTRRSTGDGYLLRALRVPEWPVVHDDDDTGASVPAVQLVVSGETWTRVEHLLGSRSYDLHYTAEADEEGAVWLRFGEGVNGREIALDTPEQPSAEIELTYRIGDPVAGNVGLGTLVEIVRPATGTDEQVALDALGSVAVTNVLPATGGREPHTLARTKEELPSSLRHGPLQRAVALEDYAAVAMDAAGVGRATARADGGLFNTVMVLVDPEGEDDLDEGLRRRVYDYVDRLRMTGREHVVLAAEYVPLEVELVLCVQPGFAAHLVRDRVLAELRPGTNERPGWFHPDRLSFGDTVRLGDLLAFVQGIAGVRSVTAAAFRPLGDATGPAVRDIIVLGRTKVARLDADTDFPEHGTLEVRVVGLEMADRRPRIRVWRITGIVVRDHASPQLRIRIVGGPRPDGTQWRMSVNQVVAAIRRGERFYVEEPVGDPVDVLIAHTHEGRVYLRTEADGDEPNNLLALPELP
ncbi:MAG: hypothetical protein QOE36_3559, partial [Gaiellaceae bacterium]|nr:hypothetical protein [Gaiellaceae bacterium]